MKDKNTGLSGSFLAHFLLFFAFPLGLSIQGLLYNLLVKQPSTPHQHLPLVFSMTHVSSKVHCNVEGGGRGSKYHSLQAKQHPSRVSEYQDDGGMWPQLKMVNVIL